MWAKQGMNTKIKKTPQTYYHSISIKHTVIKQTIWQCPSLTLHLQIKLGLLLISRLKSQYVIEREHQRESFAKAV